MQVVGHVRVDMKPVKHIMARLGIDARGDVQKFYTANVLRRIQKYMPYQILGDHPPDDGAEPGTRPARPGDCPLCPDALLWEGDDGPCDRSSGLSHRERLAVPAGRTQGGQ